MTLILLGIFVGDFRAAAHLNCNFQYQVTRNIPVLFHNLQGYDIHFIIEDIVNGFEGKVTIIPKSSEKYMLVVKKVKGTFIKFYFKDSFSFLSSSLDKLASTLSWDDFIHLRRNFRGIDEESIKLLTKKGILCYDFITSKSILRKTTSLPPKNSFYNKLNKQHISDEEYARAKLIWTKFNIQNLFQYVYLYMKCDILILTDIFERFRATSHKTFALDPIHWNSLPGYAFDTCLYYTKIELELISDLRIIYFLQQGITGGLSQVSHRYACANNEYWPGGYNKNLDKSYIIYLDANALYGSMLTLPLGYKGFCFLNEHEIENFKIHEHYDNEQFGYVLEVDLSYPDEIHDRLSDLPVAYIKKRPPNSKQEKLLATLEPKRNYVIHIWNLQYYIDELGLKLEKIHRILRFQHKPWMKGYVDLCISLRQKATHAFDVSLYKLFVNATYGKTLENVRKYRDIRLESSWPKVHKLIKAPNFYRLQMFNENLTAVEMLRSKIVFSKPTYIGFTVLESSKLHIQKFHYNIMQPYFKKNLQLNYTDTDSLIYTIKKQNVYDFMKKYPKYFDTSNYKVDNPHKILPQNARVMGLMKDELAGCCIHRGIFIRSKVYALESENDQYIKKIKGVKGLEVKNSIQFSDYKNCLFNNKNLYCSQNLIVSKKHKLYTMRQTKLALNCFDDKRQILEDGISSLPYGHYKLRKNSNVTEI